MIQNLNFVLADYALKECGSWEQLNKDIKELGLDGIEGIWDGFEIPENLPEGLVKGYHMTFYADWMDFYTENTEILKKKFGTRENMEAFYLIKNREELIKRYKADLERAKKLGSPYVVFHVSEVSPDEVFSYKFRYTDEEVMDAFAEVLNEVFRDETSGIELLMENQWWPGLTLKSRKNAEYLLSRVKYKKKGFMLDTGHFMNSDLSIKCEEDGINALNNMLDELGDLTKYIRGMHLHQSLSSDYALANTGFVPDNFPWDDYMKAFSFAYNHVLQLDRHQPWTNNGIKEIIERVKPEYLTHELSGNYGTKINNLRIQWETLNL